MNHWTLQPYRIRWRVDACARAAKTAGLEEEKCCMVFSERWREFREDSQICLIDCNLNFGVFFGGFISLIENFIKHRKLIIKFKYDICVYVYIYIMYRLFLTMEHLPIQQFGDDTGGWQWGWVFHSELMPRWVTAEDRCHAVGTLPSLGSS